MQQREKEKDREALASYLTAMSSVCVSRRTVYLVCRPRGHNMRDEGGRHKSGTNSETCHQTLN